MTLSSQDFHKTSTRQHSHLRTSKATILNQETSSLRKAHSKADRLPHHILTTNLYTSITPPTSQAPLLAHFTTAQDVLYSAIYPTIYLWPPVSFWCPSNPLSSCRPAASWWTLVRPANATVESTHSTAESCRHESHIYQWTLREMLLRATPSVQRHHQQEILRNVMSQEISC